MTKNEPQEIVIQMMENEKRGAVLDIGAGQGMLSSRLKNLGFDVTACDLDCDKFEYHKEISFIKCNLNKKLLIDKKFDYICTTEVIEHLENPYKLIRDCYSLLKENGKLIITTPNVTSYKSRILFLLFGRFFEFFPRDKERSGHINPIPYWELCDILEENGFEMEMSITNKISLTVTPKYTLKSILLKFIYIVGLITLSFIQNKGFKEFKGNGNNLIIKAVKINKDVAD